MYDLFLAHARARYLISLIIVALILFASITVADIISGLSTTNSSTNVTITNLTIAKPTDAAQGDLMVASIALHDGNATSVTPPSGWTLILRTDKETDVGIATYYKLAGASEPSNYTWTLSPQSRAQGGITRYSGVDGANPIDAAAGNTGRGQTATTSSITTAAGNEEVIAIYALHVGANNHAGNWFSTPTGMTEKYDSSYTTAGPTIASFDAIQVAAGAAGSKSSNIAGIQQRDWASQQIALRRLPSPPVVTATSTKPVDCYLASSTTFSHTVASGSNQMLVVTMGAGAVGEDTSATYDGVPMTKGNAHGNGTMSYYNYWYLTTSGGLHQGTHDVVVNFPEGSSCRQYAALTVDNVDQTTPFDTDAHVGGNGGNPSASVTTTVANELILYFLNYDDRPTNLIYTPNDPELYWVNNDITGNTHGQKGAAHVQASAGTASVGGTATGSGPWDLIAVPIRPAN